MFFLFLRGFFAVVPCPQSHPTEQLPPARRTLLPPSCLSFPGRSGSCLHLPSWQQAGSGSRSSPRRRRRRQRAGMAAGRATGSRGVEKQPGAALWARRPPAGMSAWSIIKRINEGG